MLLFPEEVNYANSRNLVANQVECAQQLLVFYSKMRNDGYFLFRADYLKPSKDFILYLAYPDRSSANRKDNATTLYILWLD